MIIYAMFFLYFGYFLNLFNKFLELFWLKKKNYKFPVVGQLTPFEK